MKSFVDAPGVISCTYCIDSGKVYGEACKADPRGHRVATGYFTLATMPTEACDVHVMVDYDPGNGVANSGCPGTVKYSLLNIKGRNFPVQVYIADAQYAWRQLPEGASMNTDPGNSFFANSLEPGVFSGISGGTHFNRGCSSHSPSSGTDDEGDDGGSEETEADE